MAFTSKLSLGVRNGGLLSSSLGLRRSNARLFSSLLQNSTASRAPRGLMTPRYLSTSNTPAAPVNPSELAQEPVSAAITPDPSSYIADGVEAASNLATAIPPLQYGDLASLGLVGWNPAGLVRWSFEVINVTTEIPWFWTIVAGTVFWRLVCVPFTIVSLRENARMQPHQKQMTVLRESVSRATGAGTIEMTKAHMKLKAFQEEHDLKPLKAMYGLFQLPVTLGLFLGVQKMASLPVEQLKESGLAAIPDLTLPDPTYLMPAALLAVVNAQISVGAKDMDLSDRPGMAHMMNGLRLLTIVGFYVMTDFSSGLMVSLLTTSTFTLVQTLLLQRPVIRALLDIPIIPKNKQGRLPTIAESFRALVDRYKKVATDYNKQSRADPFQRPRRQ